MRNILVAALTALLSFGAFAGGEATSTIFKVYADGATGYYSFFINAAASGGPGCATQKGKFVLNTSTPIGGRQLSMLMAAMLAGKTVHFYGTGKCSLARDTETLGSFSVSN